MFKIYDNPTPVIPGALYLRDANGVDWYESQARYAADTLKIVVENNCVRAASYDVSALWPLGAEVIEIPHARVPSEFSADVPEGWDVIDGELRRHVPTAEELAANARRRRDAELQKALYVLDRHDQQKRYGLDTTLTDAEARQWAIYAQALRDVPQQAGFPTQIDWPDPPA
ncbi:phage tail assembly chaperone [Chromobacterium haemolyticum]|uniref:phage tail assembly chaperone n=1 Tax=Chromobacterium haemolyticum TaxID=394935 RepID=UPI000DEF41CE|nr:phage tail assembly chaperone [Chromobacterium haemolyticum]